MNHYQCAMALSLLLPLGGSPVVAQSEAGRSTLTAADTREVITELRRRVAANYVLPEKRAAIDAALSQGLSTGRYSVSDPRELVARVNADLAAASKDGHLNISYNPEQAARLKDNESDEVRTGPAWERDAQMRNHGIITMRMIPGNIRYVAYDSFVWTGAKSAAAIDTLMAFLKEGDAVVIDLRANGGGSPLAVQYLISHFMDAGKPLVEFHMGGRSQPDRRASLPSLPNRMVGKPLYVLTSRHSASAAEEFVGHVAGFRLGEIVGETTAGAAFRNDLYDGGHGFVLSVSVGRPVLASTGGDWEGKGIAPTVAVAADAAQEAALALALRRMAQTVTGNDKKLYELRAEAHWAKAKPVSPAHPLTAYVGKYGVRTVRLEGSRLMYEREGGIRTALLPLGQNRFALDEAPTTRVEFNVAGEVAPSFELINADGTRTLAERG